MSFDLEEYHATFVAKPKKLKGRICLRCKNTFATATTNNRICATCKLKRLPKLAGEVYQ